MYMIWKYKYTNIFKLYSKELSLCNKINQQQKIDPTELIEIFKVYESLVCKDIRIRKSEFVAKTEFLSKIDYEFL